MRVPSHDPIAHNYVLSCLTCRSTVSVGHLGSVGRGGSSEGKMGKCYARITQPPPGIRLIRHLPQVSVVPHFIDHKYVKIKHRQIQPSIFFIHQVVIYKRDDHQYSYNSN